MERDDRRGLRFNWYGVISLNLREDEPKVDFGIFFEGYVFQII